MTKAESRVAIYIDFDNVVISRDHQAKETGCSAEVDIEVLLDFATRYGRPTIARAYADWSVWKNSEYKGQLVARAVELVQLFPAAKTKNGADIRLAVDAIEDLYLHPDITHVVIAAGDSDFVPLAQRARRLGRLVLGVGVAGSVSKTLASACDEYVDYDELLDQRRKLEAEETHEDAKPPRTSVGTPGPGSSTPRRRPYPLINEALQGLNTQHPERGWHPLSALKNQILRLEPGFTERDHDASSFSDLLGRYEGQIEVKDNSARLRGRA